MCQLMERQGPAVTEEHAEGTLSPTGEPSSTAETSTHIQHTETELSAARVIWNAYRSYRARRGQTLAAVDELAHEDFDTATLISTGPLEQVQYTETEFSAARTIWQAYRSYRARIKGRSPTAMSFLRDRFYTLCLAKVPSLPAKNHRYRWLFLGCLSNLLACLHSFHDYARGEKADAKRQLREVSHLKLEEMQQKITTTK